MEARIASIAKFQESITKLQGCLSSAQEDYFALQTLLEGVKAEQGSFDKEVEKLESELGTLSHPDFSFENINSLIDIIQFSICNILWSQETYLFVNSIMLAIQLGC